MGWLFRKSKTLGPLRWALGKSATGTLPPHPPRSDR